MLLFVTLGNNWKLLIIITKSFALYVYELVYSIAVIGL